MLRFIEPIMRGEYKKIESMSIKYTLFCTKLPDFLIDGRNTWIILILLSTFYRIQVSNKKQTENITTLW